MKYFFQIILLAISSPLLAQEQLSINGYLTSSVSDWEVENIIQRGDAVSYKQFRSPWLREVEFRGRSNDFNVSMEDFRFRISPLNPGEVKANKRYFQMMGDLNDLEYSRKLGMVLSGRYEDMIDHFYLSEKARILQDEKDLMSRTADIILRQRSGTEEFVKVDKALLQIELSGAEVRSGVEEIDITINEETGMSGSFDWTEVELIGPEEILNFLNTSNNTSNVNLAYTRKQLELESQRYEIRRKEAFSNLGYLQAEYDRERGNEFNEHAGYQLGIQIPIVNPDKPDLARRKIELLEEQADAMEEEMEIGLNSRLLQIRIKGSAERIDLLDQKMNRVDQLIQDRSNSIASDIEGWIELLDYRYFILNRRNDEVRMLLKNYIDYLQNEGLLSQTPLRNYIISGTPILN